MNKELTKAQQNEYDFLINKINVWNRTYREMDKMMESLDNLVELFINDHEAKMNKLIETLEQKKNELNNKLEFLAGSITDEEDDREYAVVKGQVYLIDVIISLVKTVDK